jgi:hypothetical protein
MRCPAIKLYPCFIASNAHSPALFVSKIEFEIDMQPAAVAKLLCRSGGLSSKRARPTAWPHENRKEIEACSRRLIVWFLQEHSNRAAGTMLLVRGFF